MSAAQFFDKKLVAYRTLAEFVERNQGQEWCSKEIWDRLKGEEKGRIGGWSSLRRFLPRVLHSVRLHNCLEKWDEHKVYQIEVTPKIKLVLEHSMVGRNMWTNQDRLRKLSEFIAENDGRTFSSRELQDNLLDQNSHWFSSRSQVIWCLRTLKQRRVVGYEVGVNERVKNHLAVRKQDD